MAMLAGMALSPAPTAAATAIIATATATATAASLPVPESIEQLRQWAVASGDHAAQPFVVLDKQLAQLWLFDDQGRVLGHSPVLLGKAKGDASVPGIGERPMKDILPHERTTPAGRFFAEAGENAAGEDIFWVDYDAAVSMHRVRPLVAAERRLQRLASPTPKDNRISYGCINVPVRFYDTWLKPTLSGRRGVVYVLPETMPMHKLFTPLPTAQPPSRTAAQPRSGAAWQLP
jgi:hypothetical protein